MKSAKLIVWGVGLRFLPQTVVKHLPKLFPQYFLLHLLYIIVVKRRDRRVSLPFEHRSTSKFHNQIITNITIQKTVRFCSLGENMKKEKTKQNQETQEKNHQQQKLQHCINLKISIFQLEAKKCSSKCLSLPDFSFGLDYFRLSTTTQCCDWAHWDKLFLPFPVLWSLMTVYWANNWEWSVPDCSTKKKQ